MKHRVIHGLISMIGQQMTQITTPQTPNANTIASTRFTCPSISTSNRNSRHLRFIFVLPLIIILTMIIMMIISAAQIRCAVCTYSRINVLHYHHHRHCCSSRYLPYSQASISSVKYLQLNNQKRPSLRLTSTQISFRSNDT